MAKKCKIIDKQLNGKTCVFDYDGTHAFITGTFKEYDGYLYIEKDGNAYVSVDKPTKKTVKQVRKNDVDNDPQD